MWVLTHIKTEQKLHILRDKSQYIVGRQQGDLLLSNDTSVSRDHAIIHRTDNGIAVEDKSKYGVYINKGIETNKGISKDVQIKLNVGDIIRFGRLEQIFRVEKHEIIVCQSTMNANQIQNLTKQLQCVDGTFVNVWSRNCTHLVMPNITVTVKVLQSLVCGIPIVTPNYWDAYVKNVREQCFSLPDVNDFVPETSELYLIKEPDMMKVHLDRQRIFRGKRFVFMVKRHMLNFQSIIELAGGQCLNLQENKLHKVMLLKDEFIPVEYSPIGNSQCSQNVDSVIDYVQSHGRRLINESEIGLAIIHRSMDRFCNPDHKCAADFQANTLDTNELRVNILIEETPNAQNTPAMVPGASVTIPETVDLSSTETNNNQASEIVNDDDDDVVVVEPITTRSTRKIKSPIKPAAATRRSKRINRSFDDDSDKADVPVEKEIVVPSKAKKAKKMNAPTVVQSVLSSELMPPPQVVPPPSSSSSSSQPVVSQPVTKLQPSQANLIAAGFTITQNRSKRAQDAANAQSQALAHTKETAAQNRKRAIDVLLADSDEENDKNDENDLFNFAKRSAKRSKTTVPKRTAARENLMNVSDDDDDVDNPFAFSSARSTRSQKSQAKKNSDKTPAIVQLDHNNAPDINENTFSKPYKRPSAQLTNKTLDIKPVHSISTNWITTKFKKELNLNDSTDGCEIKNDNSNEVRIKKEELNQDEDEMINESFFNRFEVRNITTNIRQSTVDETDGDIFAGSSGADSKLNRSKKSKSFVRKNNFVQRSIIIKTKPDPIVVSAYAFL